MESEKRILMFLSEIVHEVETLKYVLLKNPELKEEFEKELSKSTEYKSGLVETIKNWKN
jgi:hypothetical protein